MAKRVFVAVAGVLAMSGWAAPHPRVEPANSAPPPCRCATSREWSALFVAGDRAVLDAYGIGAPLP
ncbi:MAG: hypothetical protein HOV80_21475 [Polyangiaceae bacterium]|nr:hypothetical protein [Polyangiaceae bacterium]